MARPPPKKSLRPATLCVHAGHRANASTREVVAPIAQTSTFLLDDESYARMLSGRVDEALIYTRIRNPTLDAVQRRIAALEGAEACLVFASGMAAIHSSVMSLVRSGSRIVAHKELYGSTWDLLANFLPPLGIETVLADLNDEGDRSRALRGGAALVYCESISNPTMCVADVPAIARAAHAAGAKLVVDATFATPMLQRPLALGADLVVHSATKYLAGHSDLIGGAACGSTAAMRGVFRWLQLGGGCMDPHAAFLLDRGLKTLPLRMRAHVENAGRLATRLAEHPRVTQVLYPGLPAHASHALARDVLSGAGGMLAVVVAGGDAAALRFVRALKLALEASSLGGVETLVSLPFNTSHVKLSEAERAAAGIPPGLVRVSVGIEDVEDLIEDFEQALDASA
ncbi:MAG TPA: aminotransferase class I/II-fold pyridoxal phosphate-dependent enzyme [Planctomycetota bacterium]|jgi:cystathionine beta-lyase/cystathionine gamma-synthase|nr:aminotransferase class I/II-fold pyridoxal phosphate-dependent enzyme [Planctomycetota bacterium]